MMRQSYVRLNVAQPAITARGKKRKCGVKSFAFGLSIGNAARNTNK